MSRKLTTTQRNNWRDLATREANYEFSTGNMFLALDDLDTADQEMEALRTQRDAAKYLARDVMAKQVEAAVDREEFARLKAIVSKMEPEGYRCVNYREVGKGEQYQSVFGGARTAASQHSSYLRPILEKLPHGAPKGVKDIAEAFDTLEAALHLGLKDALAEITRVLKENEDA